MSRTTQTTGHPIWRLLAAQERTRSWLARKTGVSAELVRLIRAGERRATPAWRAKCAAELRLPEEFLFMAEEARMT